MNKKFLSSLALGVVLAIVLSAAAFVTMQPAPASGERVARKEMLLSPVSTATAKATTARVAAKVAQ